MEILTCVALRYLLLEIAQRKMLALRCGTLRCGIFYVVFNKLRKSLHCITLRYLLLEIALNTTTENKGQWINLPTHCKSAETDNMSTSQYLKCWCVHVSSFRNVIKVNLQNIKHYTAICPSVTRSLVTHMMTANKLQISCEYISECTQLANENITNYE